MTGTFGLMKSQIILHQKTAAVGLQFEPVYLPRTKDKDGVVVYRIGDKVNFVNALPLLQGQHKKEIMPMQLMHQIFPVHYLPHLPDAEPAGVARLPLGGGDLADGDGFHGVE